MKKGSLIKQSGNWILRYKKNENSPRIREMKVPDDFGIDDEVEGQEVKFDNTGGTLNYIRFNNKVYTNQKKEVKTSAESSNESPKIEAPAGYIQAKIEKKPQGIELWAEDRTELIFLPKRIIEEKTLEVLYDDAIVFLKAAPNNPNFAVSVLFDDEEIIKKDQQQRNQRPGNRQNRGRGERQQNNRPQERQPAHAPYNFVPINDQIVGAKRFSDESIIPPFDSFAEKHHSGYIDLAIEAKTKVFIGSGSSETGNYKFFAPDGTPRIPGSSLRGMVRTLVEICSWGQFKFFEDKQLFYRTFENSSMGIDFYRERMVGMHGQPKVRAGYLKKEGRKYKVIPALNNSALCNTEFYRVENTDARRIFPNLIPFTEKKVYFQPESVINQSARHQRRLDYALLNMVSQTYDPTDYPHEGKLIVSGNMPGRHGKHMHWVINLPDAKSTAKEVTLHVINTYREDANRKAEKTDPNDHNPNPRKRKKISFDVLTRLKTQGQVPCFYLEEEVKDEKEENGQTFKKKETVITAIGHTPFFRLPYQNKIGDLLPQEHKGYKGIDIPTVIFGNESTDDEDAGFAGRVFFEDAVCTSNCNNREATTHRGQATAISPKPTSFQLYLKQDSIDVDKEDLKHYDSKDENNKHAELRGNKLYWHKTPDSNNTDKLQFNNTRIRFTNLNDVELGALLFALDLPEGCCHKIGMGKPLGLGSIRITPKLHLEKPEKKYQSFAAAMNYKPEEAMIDYFKSTFESFIKKEINHTNANLWEHDRLKELKKMLDFAHKPDDSKTNYMGNYSAFADRKVLPDATDVK